MVASKKAQRTKKRFSVYISEEFMVHDNYFILTHLRTTSMYFIIFFLIEFMNPLTFVLFALFTFD